MIKIRRIIRWIVIILCTVCVLALHGPKVSVLSQGKATAPVLKTATHHLMQYYISLPEGWTPNTQWPIVVTVTGRLKNFQHNAQVFADARKQLPFIIVTPVNLTNGGNNLRTLPEYNYAPSVWDQVDKTSWCDFDLKGLDAVMDDVKKQYNGQEKILYCRPFCRRPSGFDYGLHTP